jgi:hypothetical protein
MRLGLLNNQYMALAKKAYQGLINQFMVSDGQGGVHLIGCCKSAGLGGKNFRDGSAAYYLMGQDTEPTVADPSSPSFYTEGKVLGGFIMAATEYERLFNPITTAVTTPKSQLRHIQSVWSISGKKLSKEPKHQIYIKEGTKRVTF